MKDGTFTADRLLALYDRVAEAEDAIPRLRRFVQDLAVRGKLVEQDPSDEPAAELLQRIAKEKARLVKAGEIKAGKPSQPISDVPFQVAQSWLWVRLAELASYIQRGKSPQYATADGMPVVSQKCVQWSGLDLAVARKITVDSLNNYEPVRFLRSGDLLWNSTGTGTIGRLVRLGEVPAKLVCDSHVTVVRCVLADPEYVRIWLMSDHVYGLIEGKASGSTNQVELTAQMAHAQPVPLPPLAEQQRIVAKVEALMALCDQLEASLTTATTTRSRLLESLLNEALNGALGDLPEVAA
jgi:type I restriction enzyme S subunit